MSYADKAAKAVKAGKVEDLVCGIFRFENEGDTLIGKLVAVEQFQGKDGKGECKKYIFDTDDGPQSCILGQATDSRLASDNLVGHVLIIEYKGSKKLDKDRNVNVFNIQDCGPA